MIGLGDRICGPWSLNRSGSGVVQLVGGVVRLGGAVELVRSLGELGGVPSSSRFLEEYSSMRIGSSRRSLTSDGFDADGSFHFGPDADLGQRVPDGTAGARLNEHLFTVAHDEALVAESQWVNSFTAQARVGENLRAGQTIATTFLEDTDVFQS